MSEEPSSVEERLLRALFWMVVQNCRELEHKDGTRMLDSGFLGANAEAMRILIEAGMVEEQVNKGRYVCIKIADEVIKNIP